MGESALSLRQTSDVVADHASVAGYGRSVRRDVSFTVPFARVVDPLDAHHTLIIYPC